MSEGGKVQLISVMIEMAELAGMAFEVTLLRPTISATVDHRTQALVKWCEGFSGGFGWLSGRRTWRESGSAPARFAAIAPGP